MTGELTLRGKVLPIGGLKEKLLAAARAGITTVIIPAGNAPELSEIPPHVTAKLTVKPVRTMDEVLDIALVGLAGGDEEGGGQGDRRDPAPPPQNRLPPRHRLAIFLPLPLAGEGRGEGKPCERSARAERVGRGQALRAAALARERAGRGQALRAAALARGRCG